MCENMTSLGISINGGFAEYNVAPAKVLHPISSHLRSELAIFAESLSSVVNATQMLRIHPGESGVVLGAGPSGLLFTQLFKASGAGEIIVSEISRYREKFPKESGATLTVNPLREDLQKIVKERTKVGADVVVDTVGTLLEQALTLVRRGGRVLLYGMNSKAKNEIFQNDITLDEITVMGSNGLQYCFPLTLKIIESGNLKLNKLITHRLSLKELPQGIEVMKRREAIKVVIKP